MEMDKVLPQDIINSLQLEENRKQVFKSGQGAGLSGSFFFFSKDNRFIIKTMNKTERNIMLSILDDYIEHIK